MPFIHLGSRKAGKSLLNATRRLSVCKFSARVSKLSLPDPCRKREREISWLCYGLGEIWMGINVGEEENGEPKVDMGK